MDEERSIVASLGKKMLITAVLASIAFFVSLQMTTPHESQSGATLTTGTAEPNAVALPSSDSGEERRALRVIELAEKGDHEQAKREAEAFLRDFPNGPFTERVRNAVAR
jgi:hypothetical protein